METKTKKFLEVTARWLKDYKIKLLVDDENRIEIVLINERIMRTEYFLSYRKDINSFVDIVGIWWNASQYFTWYLQQITEELYESSKNN